MKYAFIGGSPIMNLSPLPLPSPPPPSLSLSLTHVLNTYTWSSMHGFTDLLLALDNTTAVVGKTHSS